MKTPKKYFSKLGNVSKRDTQLFGASQGNVSRKAQVIVCLKNGQSKKDKVWYAVYGTNLNVPRFSCYIKGGIPEGTSKTDIGCHDKTMAIDGGKILIPLQLYFAQKSPRWENKAVGFVNSKINLAIRTLGRKYLITKDQFEDVFKQENGIDIEKKIHIDFNNAREKGAITLQKSWYGRVIFLGEEEGIPIYTLTAHWDFKYEEIASPSYSYIRHIIMGIKQTYNLFDEQIAEYLYQKPGVDINFSKKELLKITQEL